MTLKGIFSTALATLSAALVLASCGGGGAGDSTVVVPAEIVKPTKPVVILVFGDSISAVSGIEPGREWVSLLRQKISAERLDEFAPVTVVNESLPGEFALEAVDRLPSVLARVKPTHVLLAHGTNDARTSFPWDVVTKSMTDMVSITRNSGAKPYLLDFTLTAYGPEVAAQYTAAFKEAARLSAAPYVGVVTNLVFNPAYYDSSIPFHLNDAAQPLIMENLWAVLASSL
jgi:acyl-CoA thioesterase-1